MDDEPVRKRQKTGSPDAHERSSSPLKQPPRKPPSTGYHLFERGASSPLKAPPRRKSGSPTKDPSERLKSPLKEKPRRPSFASPTKASLSRHHPQLLQKATSPSRKTLNGHTNVSNRDKQARAFGYEDAFANTNSDDATAGAQLPSRLRDSDKHTRVPGVWRTARIASANVNSGEEVELSTMSSPENSTDNRVEHDREVVIQQQREVLEPLNPEIERKKRERDRLKEKLLSLENEVVKYPDWVEKLQAQSEVGILRSREREDLISLINKTNQDGQGDDQGVAPSISTQLCSFLPFSVPTIIPPKREKNLIGSHQPVDTPDPLVYLGMFTNFQFETKLDLPRVQSFPSNRVHQKHIIDITGPQSLLKASISIIIDTLTNSIIDLKLLELSPWANSELGPFIREKALKHDVGNACWAISSYWDIAKKRARYWHQCEVAFGHLIVEYVEEDRKNAVLTHQEKSTQSLSRKDFNRHLGRDMIVLEDKHVLLKLKWKITFDWTGEAQSEIGVVSAVPRVCRFCSPLQRLPAHPANQLQGRKQTV